MPEFAYTSFAQHILFGAGALAQLPKTLAAAGWERVTLVTTGSARRAGRAAQVEALLGARLAGTFDAAQPHVPQPQVDEVAGLAEAHQAQALTPLGGGSAVGLAKAASLALEPARGGRPVGAARPTEQAHVPVAAIP